MGQVEVMIVWDWNTNTLVKKLRDNEARISDHPIPTICAPDYLLIL